MKVIDRVVEWRKKGIRYVCLKNVLWGLVKVECRKKGCETAKMAGKGVLGGKKMRWYAFCICIYEKFFVILQRILCDRANYACVRMNKS
jgi:hypothetical protein